MTAASFPVSRHRRALVAGAGAAAVLAVAGCAAPTPARRPVGTTPTLRLLGESRLPHRLTYRDTVVGGLSALDRDPASGLWYALSDDGSAISPARFYSLRLPLSRHGPGTPELVDVTLLRTPAGDAFPGPRQGGIGPDPEGLRFRPQAGTVLWTSEGDIRQGQSPWLREASLDGRFLREFPMPAMFAAGASAGSGPRHNLGFEGLALLPDGSGAWVAMENALWQDGPEPGVGTPGGPCRFTLFDMAGGQATRQVAYVPDAIPQAPRPAGAFADNGVSEILMADDHRMLVLERAYMAGVGNSLRVYLIDTRAGSDTLGTPALAPGNHRPCAKALVADFSQSGLARLDNVEAMAWGPRLPGGQRTLVFASDDNFNPAQITQFVAFEFQEQA